MEKYIPYEKLSKKEKRKIDAARRTTWGPVSPVTRTPVSSKAYNRRKARSLKPSLPDSGSFFMLFRTGPSAPAGISCRH